MKKMDTYEENLNMKDQYVGSVVSNDKLKWRQNPFDFFSYKKET